MSNLSWNTRQDSLKRMSRDAKTSASLCGCQEMQRRPHRYADVKRCKDVRIVMQNISKTSKVLILKNSNLISINFWSSFLMSQKFPTMSPHQEATASSTSSLIWGLKEFTEVVESPSRPWSSLSCFETTPSIQVSKYPSIPVSKYPSIHVSKYPSIQVSKYQSIQVSK